jgi:hypothetical protein
LIIVLASFGEPTGRGWPQFAALALALVLSASMGLEREIRQKSAGLRMHTLVGFASALIMLVSKPSGSWSIEPNNTTLKYEEIGRIDVLSGGYRNWRLSTSGRSTPGRANSISAMSGSPRTVPGRLPVQPGRRPRRRGATRLGRGRDLRPARVRPNRRQGRVDAGRNQRRLGTLSSGRRGRLDMEENWPARDVGADNPNVSQGNDYEYDEAHDTQAGPMGTASTPRPVNPPDVNMGDDGDYGYDEAHDFGTR